MVLDYEVTALQEPDVWKLLDHLDTRFKSIELALIERTKSIETALIELRNDLKINYVTQREFAPVKLAVYGIIGTLCTGVVTAILGLVLTN